MKRFLVITFLISAISINYAIQWPLKSGKLTSTYAESRWDHFHDGIDMTNADGKIYPSENGKLLFYWDKSKFPMDNYKGGGNFKVISHNKGYSLYMHLEDTMPVKTDCLINEPIATAGNTGHSFGKHLHFTLLDDLFNSYNPMSADLIPEDKNPPVVGDVHIKINEKYITLRSGTDIRLTKHYPLLISIHDTISGGEKLGVYKLKVEINGKTIADTIFNKISNSKNGLTLSGKYHDNLFDNKGYYKIEDIQYADGQNTITVTAEDYSNNIIQKIFTFNIKLDTEISKN